MGADEVIIMPVMGQPASLQGQSMDFDQHTGTTSSESTSDIEDRRFVRMMMMARSFFSDRAQDCVSLLFCTFPCKCARRVVHVSTNTGVRLLPIAHTCLRLLFVGRFWLHGRQLAGRVNSRPNDPRIRPGRENPRMSTDVDTHQTVVDQYT